MKRAMRTKIPFKRLFCMQNTCSGDYCGLHSMSMYEFLSIWTGKKSGAPKSERRFQMNNENKNTLNEWEQVRISKYVRHNVFFLFEIYNFHLLHAGEMLLTKWFRSMMEWRDLAYRCSQLIVLAYMINMKYFHSSFVYNPIPLQVYSAFISFYHYSTAVLFCTSKTQRTHKM